MGYEVKNAVWRNSRERLLSLLKEIREAPDGHRGICQHLMDKEKGASILTLFMFYAREWELAKTGGFIIPNPDILGSPLQAYYEAKSEGKLWDTSTQYGIWRWELLDFVIARLMEDLE